MKVIEIDNQSNYNLEKNSVFYGVISGLLMALFILSLHFLGTEKSIGLKMVKYLILLGFTGYALNELKKQSEPITFFKKGIFLGAQISVAAGLTFTALNFLLFFVNKDYAFGRFFEEPDSLLNLAVISGSTLLEILVFGMVATFISLQALKFKRKGSV